MNTKNRVIAILIVIAIATLAGCTATTIQTPKDGLDIAIRDASDYLNNNIPNGNKIVILNIQSASSDLSDYIIDELIANAVNDKTFSVVDRQQLDLIRAEQNFQWSGEVDDSAALEIGRFFGAQTIVSGSIRRLGRGYRITIRALEVRTTQVQGQYNLNIIETQMIRDLLASDNTSSSTATRTNVNPSQTRTSQTTTNSGTGRPSPTLLQFSSPVGGNISGGGEYWYSVIPASSGNVTVETTGSTDTYMHAYNSNYEEIATNDDGGEGNNARITIYANANQTYYFKVRGYSSSTNGSYRVVANFVSESSSSGGSNMSSSILLQFSSPVSGSIFSGREYWYSVRPTSNGNITVETTGSTDTYMHAYNASGGEIATNDDGGQGNNAKITIFANANQTYYFKVRGYSSSTSGSYNVVANFVSDSGGGGNSNMSSSIPLQFNSPVSGNISNGREFWYSVRPTSNGNLTVETTGSTDTYMHAYNANGEELATNDDGGQGSNARITIYANANQTYYFKVRGYSSNTSGSYNAVASFVSDSGGSGGTSMSSSIPLQYNSPVAGSIFSGREYWYSVRPTSNGNLTVETTGSTDTYMHAYNANGEEIATNDDGGQGSNARITISVSANQTYYFKVRGYSSSTSGSYNVVANFRTN